MALYLHLRQAAFLLAICSIAAVANDEDPVPASGASFAQGAVKFSGAALLSETPGQTMDEFASLEDAFEYKPTGVAAQDEFASLEDAFDYKANFAEAEVVEFDIREFLMSPALYFTISMVLFAGVFLTEPHLWVHREAAPLTQDTSKPQDSVAPADTQSNFIEKDNQQADSRNVDAAATETKKATLPSLALNSIKAEDKCEEESNPELLAAVDACRAGEAGSYANFCKVLSAQNSQVQ